MGRIPTPGVFRKSGKQRICGIRNLEVCTENGRSDGAQRRAGAVRKERAENGKVKIESGERLGKETLGTRTQQEILSYNTWLTITCTPPRIFQKC